jgi:hypothetical protein
MKQARTDAGSIKAWNSDYTTGGNGERPAFQANQANNLALAANK